MGRVLGLELHDEILRGVVVRRGPLGVRVETAFTVPVGETAAETLRAKLRELGVRTRQAHVALPRRWAIVKPLDLPPIREGDLARLVGFELERHLPFPAEEAVYDFQILEVRPGGPTRVLLVAVERRTLERVQRLLREAGLVPRLVDLGLHSLAALGGGGGAHLHLRPEEGELAIVRHGRLLLSRAFPLPEGDGPERGRVLAEELRRSLGALPEGERATVARLTLTGDEEPADAAAIDLPLAPSSPVPSGLQRQLARVGDGSLLPALAIALRRPRRGPLRTNLLPEALRPRPFPVLQLATVGLLLLSLALAVAEPFVTTLRDERYLARLNRAIEGLAPEVREVERVVAGLERRRQELDTLKRLRDRAIRPLPVLKELTELLPGEVWLTNLTLDQKGLELAGFATAASPLIPLLEGSPTLDRVEFTSPVTTRRDKEQFRLKAAWEQPPRGVTEPRPADRRGMP